MKIVIPKETRAGETRVAASPQVIQKLVGLGYDVAVEKGAGEGASVSDDVYKAAGASIATAAALKTADIVLMVNPPATSGAGPDEEGRRADLATGGPDLAG